MIDMRRLVAVYNQLSQNVSFWTDLCDVLQGQKELAKR